jgi:hypothetical protein
MKTVFYENVGLQSLKSADANPAPTHEDYFRPGLKTAVKKTSDHEFLDILQSTIEEMELRDDDHNLTPHD